MTNTIRVTIHGVCQGYEHKSSPYYKKEFGYFIHPIINGHGTFVWRKTYTELKEYVKDFYGIELPNESELRFVNWGSPYNSAAL